MKKALAAALCGVLFTATMTVPQVYQIYLRYVSPEDICVYSVDEVFIDVTGYLATYRVTARQLAAQMIEAVLSETGMDAVSVTVMVCSSRRSETAIR